MVCFLTLASIFVGCETIDLVVIIFLELLLIVLFMRQWETGSGHARELLRLLLLEIMRGFDDYLKQQLLSSFPIKLYAPGSNQTVDTDSSIECLIKVINYIVG